MLHARTASSGCSLSPAPSALPADWSFAVDKVLHSASQEDVYDTCARDIVSKALDGFK